VLRWNVAALFIDGLLLAHSVYLFLPKIRNIVSVQRVGGESE
jgi:hypothetical protein